MLSISESFKSTSILYKKSSTIASLKELQKKLLNFAHHYEFEESGLKINDLRKLIENFAVRRPCHSHMGWPRMFLLRTCVQWWDRRCVRGGGPHRPWSPRVAEIFPGVTQVMSNMI